MVQIEMKWFYLIGVCCTIPTSTLACDIGWFGPKCEYKCHCTDGHCTTAGLCANNVDCARGWFGPLCQYQDLVSLGSIAPPMSGVTSVKVTSVRVMWWRLYLIQWLRLQFQEIDQPDVFTLQTGAGPASLNCTQLKVYLIDNRTIDLVCDTQVPAAEVKVTWAQPKLLRTLYISGGRNVALKQTAQLTSTYDDLTLASHAVDGNTNTNYMGRSCVHTRESDSSPALTLTLSRPYLLTRYEVYNRYDDMCCPERLKGFVLKSYNGQTLVYTYTDVARDPLRQYTIVPNRGGNPVTRVNIAANYINPGTTRKILSLCEVELFGDSICPAGRYGLDCSSTCMCQNKSEPCHVATGLCPSVCPAGYWGQGCRYECPDGRWGIGCLQTCSESCEGGQCEKTSGVCTHGCVGYTSPNCSQVCEPGWYGSNCSLSCDVNCKDPCHHITGYCTLDVPVGFDNVTHVQTSSNPSGSCCDGGCDRGNGSHLERDGYRGEDKQTVDITSTSSIGIGIGIAVAVIIVFTIGIAVYCRRIKTSTKNGEHIWSETVSSEKLRDEIRHDVGHRTDQARSEITMTNKCDAIDPSTGKTNELIGTSEDRGFSEV
ncbi:uncharacterized protein LOC131927060 [Physella acuta]|uniref:uncharacterized protein LOC131927060 n=1 Tax=Physella acuta TaxID=109671 RepID=UPI0027DBB974|nr:uncharacterized protein LOC131927060 [Physella acuta]